MVFCCLAANAQLISFGENDVATAGDLDGKSFSNGDFSLTITDTNGKVAVDASNCYFGTADQYVKYTHRLKSGGKSSSKNMMTLSIPSDGTLNLSVRTASNSATDRNLVVSQDGESLFDEVIQEEGGYEEVTFEGAEKATNVYKVVSVPVKKGSVELTYPTGALNFYAFELVSDAAEVGPSSYDINIISDPESSYYSGGEDLSVADLVSALGLADADALKALLEGNQAFYIQTADGKSNECTGGTGENAFWMNAEGAAQGYSADGSCWYVGIYWNDANEEEGTPAYVDIHAGQMPKYFSKIYDTDTDLSQVFYLVNGDKQVTFNVKLHVNAAKEPEALSLSTLNIVKDYEIELPFTTGKYYEGMTVTATLDGLYDALGVAAADFDSTIADATYTQVVEGTTENEVTTYTLADGLQTLSAADTDGWFGRYTNWDESAGKETTLEPNAPKNHGAGCTFYIQSLKLENGEFSFITGQYQNTMAKDATDYTYLYVVNGTQAARLKIKPVLTDPETVNPDELVMAGETSITVKQNPTPGYGTESFEIDMAAIAEALGCEVSDLDNSTLYSWGADGQISDDRSQGSGQGGTGGFYFDADGKIGHWSGTLESSAAYFISLNSLPDGVFNIGQRDGYFNADDLTEDFTSTCALIFVYNQKYYVVNVNYVITNDKLIEDDGWERVYAAAYDVQLIDSEGYGQADESQTTIDIADICDAVGTTNPKLYTESWATGDDGTETWEFSKAYSCDPHPGFWMSADGRSAGTWGNSPSYGMSYASGVITYYCIAGNHNAGDEYQSRFYLVNEETGKYAQITLNVAFVDVRGAVAGEVGSTDVKVYLTEETENEETGCYEGDEGVNWDEVYEALGITADEVPDCTWMITNSYGKLVNVSADSSFEADNNMFDANGYKVDDPADCVFTVGFNNDTNKFMITTVDTPEDGVVYSTKVALKSDKGFYTFNIQAGVSLSEGLKGDVNQDGFVDISDIVAIINQIAGTATWPLADVNEDKNVDISDIVAVINIIAEQ